MEDQRKVDIHKKHEYSTLHQSLDKTEIGKNLKYVCIVICCMIKRTENFRNIVVSLLQGLKFSAKIVQEARVYDRSHRVVRTCTGESDACRHATFDAYKLNIK